MELETIQLDLAILRDGRAPGLTPAAGWHLAEAGAVALDRGGNARPAQFVVIGHDEARAEITFGPVDDQARRAHADQQELTEEGAVGIALTYLRQRHGEIVVQRSMKRTGFDYHVGPRQITDGPPFTTTARAEVTGLDAEEGEGPIQARRRAKRRQVDQSAGTRLPAWIIYVRFGRKTLEVEQVAAREVA